MDGERHTHGDDHTGGRADRHTQNHLVGVLQVGDVGGHTGDQAGGGKFVDVGKAEGLDVFEHRTAQVAGVAGGGTGTQHTAHNAEEQTHSGCHDHPAANAVDDGQVAGGDAVVNDGGHQLRQDHLHDDLADHTNRRQDRNQTDAFCFFGKCVQQISLLLSYSGRGFDDVLRILQKDIQPPAHRRQLLLRKPCLQLGFVAVDGIVYAVVVGNALGGRLQPFEAGILLHGAAGDQPRLLHILQHGSDAGALDMQPFFNVALVEIAALAVGGDNAPQHHALRTAQLGGDLRRNAGVQGAADGAGNL